MESMEYMEKNGREGNEDWLLSSSRDKIHSLGLNNLNPFSKPEQSVKSVSERSI